MHSVAFFIPVDINQLNQHIKNNQTKIKKMHFFIFNLIHFRVMINNLHVYIHDYGQ